jgi:hypothetical protein
MYEVPTPEDFRGWLKTQNLTGAQAGKILGMDARTIRRYTAPEDQAGHRAIPWSAWILLRLYTGELSLKEYRAMITRPETPDA